MTTFVSIAGDFSNISVNEATPFHDGQPHIRMTTGIEDDELTNDRVNILCRIATSQDLMHLGMAVDVLRRANVDVKIDLGLLYLWGRMDRPISPEEPYTLKVACNFINSLNLNSVSVFCPHSAATGDLLHRYVAWSQLSEDIFFKDGIVACAIRFGFGCTQKDVSFVYPDIGAGKRFSKSSILETYDQVSLVTMHKHRDERTGKIHGMKILQGEVKKNCIILDDLCDGGATFSGAAAVLREAGAEKVGLVIPHGIFSKGTTIPGIDYVFTSNSYREWEPHETLGVHKLP